MIRAARGRAVRPPLVQAPLARGRGARAARVDGAPPRAGGGDASVDVFEGLGEPEDLVFGTLHTSTAASTVDRIIDQFPHEQQNQIRAMLAESLGGVLAQTLCRTRDGKGRRAALEVLRCDQRAASPLGVQL